MVAIVDYGVGNLFSLKCSLEAVGAKVIVSSDKTVLASADQVILPGVGAFDDAARKLRESGLSDYICTLAKSGKPLLGICLGMQLLFDKSYEYGEHKGLGLIPGDVVPIDAPGLKIPHIGWNPLIIKRKVKLFENINDGDCVYFVHSFCAVNCDNNVIATAEYGTEVTAAVQNKNVIGCQFHPEKSGKVGLKILKAFTEMKGEGVC